MNQNYQNPLDSLNNNIFIMTLQTTICAIVIITIYSYLNSIYFSYPNSLANVPKWLIKQHESRKTPYTDGFENISKNKHNKHNNHNDVEIILSRNESKENQNYYSVTVCCSSILDLLQKSLYICHITNKHEKDEITNAYTDYLQYEIRKLKTELLTNIAMVNTPSDTTTITSMSPSQTDDSMEYVDAIEGKFNNTNTTNTNTINAGTPMLEHEHRTMHVSYNSESSTGSGSGSHSHSHSYSHSNGDEENPLNIEEGIEQSTSPSTNPLLDSITNHVEILLEDFNSINQCVENQIFHNRINNNEHNNENEEDME